MQETTRENQSEQSQLTALALLYLVQLATVVSNA